MIELDQILVGTLANDKTGDPLRNAFQKVNANMVTIAQHIDELEAGGNLGSDFPNGTQVLIRDTRDITNTTGALHVFGGVQVDKNIYVQESIFIGTGSNVSELTEPVFIGRRDGVQFVQGSIINTSAFGSADLIAYADTGSDAEGWADIGFTGSGFNDPNYTVTGPGDGYVFVQGLNDGVSHGELHLATGDYGLTRDIVFSTGGFLVENEVMRYVHLDNVFNINHDLRVNGELQTLKIVGMGEDSGDGNGYSTIELIPDNSLYANAQYLIIDPTAPSHIHIRAGGPQDSSPADLFLGGEANYVRVNDSQGVRIQNNYTLDDFFYYNPGADFTDATWFTEGGNHYVQFTTTNAIMVSKFWDFTNGTPNQLIVYDGVGSHTLDYGGSGSNISPDVYKVQVTQAPPEGITIATLEFHIFTTTTNALQLENNDFRLEVGDDIRMYARDVFRLYNYSTSQGIQITTDWDNNEYTWEFGVDGDLQLPFNGGIKDANGNYLTPKVSTVAPTLTNVLTEVVSVPASNPNWLNGTGVAGGVANANISISMTDGVPSFTINDAGDPGRYVGETIFTVPGSTLGGTDGVDDMSINVSAVTNTGSGVIDLTKQTHVLETGDYTLADGYEGQVLHFVLKLGATNVFNSVWVQVANVRYINPNDATTSEFTSTWWAPFSKANDNYILNGVATAVFADGAWNLTGGILD